MKIQNASKFARMAIIRQAHQTGSLRQIRRNSNISIIVKSLKLALHRCKTGEGGQLPGIKVNSLIAKLRHSTPGVTLISPPPHHDIHSIEDLAQLIYDLKQINPDARVCVKLVASTGIGTIAAGVAKRKSRYNSDLRTWWRHRSKPAIFYQHAGMPWEMGLSEVHQVLSMNGLREQVVLRTDGGLKTGRDIVMAAMLGADEFGIGTSALVAMGCIMVRQCHSNTCPVGVCTQRDDLREKFEGTLKGGSAHPHR